MYYSVILCSCFSKRGVRISALNPDISYHDFGFVIVSVPLFMQEFTTFAFGVLLCWSPCNPTF